MIYDSDQLRMPATISMQDMEIAKVEASDKEPAAHSSCPAIIFDRFQIAHISVVDPSHQKNSIPTLEWLSVPPKVKSPHDSQLRNLDGTSDMMFLSPDFQREHQTPSKFKLPDDLDAASSVLYSGSDFVQQLSNSMSSEQAFSSAGSQGHPEFCSRPCIYFLQGNCSVGSNCKFCHEEHLKRPIHLDKINRTTLRSLSSTDQKLLLLSAMKHRAAQELPYEKLVLFLQKLQDYSGLPSGSISQGPVYEGWREQRLMDKLLQIPLMSQFKIMVNCDRDMQEATETQLVQGFRMSLLDQSNI